MTINAGSLTASPLPHLVLLFVVSKPSLTTVHMPYSLFQPFGGFFSLWRLWRLHHSSSRSDATGLLRPTSDLPNAGTSNTLRTRLVLVLLGPEVDFVIERK